MLMMGFGATHKAGFHSLRGAYILLCAGSSQLWSIIARHYIGWFSVYLQRLSQSCPSLLKGSPQVPSKNFIL